MTSIRRLAASFARQQQAERKSPHTIRTYNLAIRQLADWLDTQHGSDEIALVTKRALADYLAERGQTIAPATQSIAFRSLRVFLRWAVDEDELPTDPTARMRQPRVPMKPPPVFTEDELHRLLTTCQGSAFLDRRDLALMRFLIDTGARRGEVAGLKVTDIDLDRQQAVVTGKTGTRAVPMGSKTTVAMDRYLRARQRRHGSEQDALWLGVGGNAMTPNGLYQAIRERGKQAGVDGMFLHRFRHDFASRFRLNGGQDSDLLVLGGWSNRGLLDRYGAATKQERAFEAHKRIGIGDRI